MTVVVGILCSDGVVIGADGAATFGTGQVHTIEQATKKIDIINERVILAGAGQVGLHQRFKKIVEDGGSHKHFTGTTHKDHIDIGTHFTREALNDLASTRMPTGHYAALMAFPHKKKPYLCEFAQSDFQPEFKDDRIWFVSMGCGQPIVDPFLALIRSVFWEDGARY